MLGIGVDADQGYLGDHILTSAQKKVDVAVFETAKAVQDGAFAGGEDQIFDLKQRRRRARQAQRRRREVRRSDGGDQAADHRRRDHRHPGGGQVANTQKHHADARRHARPRAARDHEALRLAGRERRDRLRAEARRDPRAARGERGRQVDADERPLRAPPPGRGRDQARRRAGDDRLRAGGDRAGHRHGPPALHARPGHDRGREPGAGDRALARAAPGLQGGGAARA